MVRIREKRATRILYGRLLRFGRMSELASSLKRFRTFRMLKYASVFFVEMGLGLMSVETLSISQAGRNER
jgi:hypothetical protein